MRLICLCAFRDATAYLPDFLKCIKNYVDGAIMYDDGSKDGGISICEQHPIVIETIEDTRGVTHSAHSRESGNREFLLNAAIKAGASHVLCLDDDERPEHRFIRELKRFIQLSPETAISVRVRDLWNSQNQYRIDPPWCDKRKVVCFPLQPFAEYHAAGALHQPWMPPKQTAPVCDTDFNLFHLGSLTPELRRARVEKFERIDPEHKWQSDYRYLADETGIVLETIPEGRGWK